MKPIGEGAIFSAGIGRGVDGLLREGKEDLRVANRGRMTGALCDEAKGALRPLAAVVRVVTSQSVALG
jgi:hypothetical protein